jgi:hypothetical protein
MSKTYKGDVTGNVVELNLLDANEGTLPNLGTPTVVTKNTGANVVEQIVGDIPNYSFGSSPYYLSTVRGVVIGTSCTSIGSYSFSYLESFSPTVPLGPLTIPDSVTSIGSGAFSYNYFTGSLTIGNNVTSIGSTAFAYCTSLTGSLVIPDSVTTIENYAFTSCTGLNGSLTIGNSVTSIESSAFNNCNILTAVYTNTPASSFTGSSAFSNTSFTTIYTGPNATGYTSSFQGRTGLTIAPWTNYPNIP